MEQGTGGETSVEADLGPFRRGAGVVDRAGRAILTFSGPQARWFLDQLVTGSVIDRAAGSGADVLLLTPKGRITAAMRLWVTGDEEVTAFLDPGAAATVSPFFEGRVFATRVTIEDRSASAALVTVLGPRADAVAEQALSALGVPSARLPGDDEHANVAVADAGAVLARVTRPVRGLDLLVDAARRDDALGALDAAGGARCPVPALDALSVVEGLARFGVDFDERFLPQEAAMERAVHFAKGCYLGQEAVAMAQRGRVKRRLRHLAFEGPAVVGPLLLDEELVGRVTSVADEDGRGWGIAVVATKVAPGTVVDVTPEAGPGTRAEVRELPGTTEGPRVPSARELRERLAGSGERTER